MATNRQTRTVLPQSPTAAPLHSRRMIVFAAALSAMVIAAGLVWTALGAMPGISKSFPVREVIFVSATDAPLMEIDNDSLHRVATALQTRGASMMLLDLDALKNGVKKIAWVRDANVRRQFPATIIVAIEEHKPVAAWGFVAPEAVVSNEDSQPNPQSRLVNSFGEIFLAQISDERKSTLPRLYGPEGTATEVLEKYVVMLAPLKIVGRAPARLLLTERRAWQVTLDNGSHLQLGRSDTDIRLDRYIQTFPQIAALQTAGVNVDLRYQTGFTILEGQPASNAKSINKVLGKKKTA